jgi:PAS domain S-box-containing protein
MTDDVDHVDTSTEDAFAALLEESARDLYEHAPCGYLSTTPEGTIVKTNETFLRWTGYERAAVVGEMRFADLLAPGDRIYFETHVRPLLHLQGGVHEIAVEIVCADGRRLPALVNAEVHADELGTPLLVRTTVLNATERREYERELLRARREAEARARAASALEHVADGVVLVDADGRIGAINPAAAALLGVDAGTALGAEIGGAVEGWNEIAGSIPVASADAPTPAAVLPLAGSRGERWLSVRGASAGDDVVYTIRDVTAERRLDELRNDLIAVVSHELRTPLAGAYGAALTLRDNATRLDDDSRRTLLDLIVSQSERLRVLVERVLEAGQLDAGGIEFAQAPIDAPGVVRSVVDAFDDDRVVVGEIAPARALGDEPRLHQVLVNLVENALKYSPEDAPVRVAVVPTRHRARFTVSDEGPGIPPAEHANVFEKFYRLDPGQLAGVGGIGLGLYIARELVERMGGRIGILPAKAGATFFVDLPLAAEERERRSGD